MEQTINMLDSANFWNYHNREEERKSSREVTLALPHASIFQNSLDLDGFTPMQFR